MPACPLSPSARSEISWKSRPEDHVHRTSTMNRGEKSAHGGAGKMLDKRLLLCLIAALFCTSFALYLYFDMRFNAVALAAAAACSIGCNAQTQYTSTAASAVAAAKATALTLSPVSSIKGKRFDRFVQIWLENTDYSMAAGDRKLLRPLSGDTNLKSITTMGRQPRDHAHQLSRNYSSLSAKLRCICRWPNPLGTGRLGFTYWQVCPDYCRSA